MSIEPMCGYCGISDKSSCKTQDQAKKCSYYVRKNQIEEQINRRKKERERKINDEAVRVRRSFTFDDTTRSVSTKPLKVCEKSDTIYLSRGDTGFYVNKAEARKLIEILTELTK